MKKHYNHSIKKNSKSFYFASLFLSKNTFQKTATLYKLCRKIDDIADKENTNKKIKLKKIMSQINEKSNNSISGLKDIKSLLKNNIIPYECINELIQGVLLDTKRVHIKNTSNLINYSYLVAGTVGIMMSSILGSKNIYSYKYAVDLGIAMQLTNILRDILEDAKMKRVYIPISWYNIRYKRIINQDKLTKSNLKKVSKKIFQLSERFYNSAFKGLGFLPFRARFTTLLAATLYRQIGIKIVKNNYSNLNKREIISFEEKLLCLIKVIFIFFSNIKIHLKNYTHNNMLHKSINNNYYLKKGLSEKKSN